MLARVLSYASKEGRHQLHRHAAGECAIELASAPDTLKWVPLDQARSSQGQLQCLGCRRRPAQPYRALGGMHRAVDRALDGMHRAVDRALGGMHRAVDRAPHALLSCCECIYPWRACSTQPSTSSQCSIAVCRLPFT